MGFNAKPPRCEGETTLGFMALREFVEGGLEGGDEVGVHELEVVGNVEAVDGFFGDGFGEFALEVVAMFAFHDENFVSPAQETFGDANAGGGFGTGRFDGVARRVAEDFLSGATAPFVHAADEEEFGGVGHGF